MTRKILLSAAVLALGLGACNEGTLPTDAEHALNNPDKTLGRSAFGQALALEAAVVADPVIDPQNPSDPVAPSDSGEIHISEGNDKSKYRPVGYEHIKDDYNRSKYKPRGDEHIKDGDDKSKYKPGGWVHYNGERAIDKSKYIPSGYQHIAKGPNETRYSKTGTSTGIEDGEVIPGNH